MDSVILLIPVLGTCSYSEVARPSLRAINYRQPLFFRLTETIMIKPDRAEGGVFSLHADKDGGG